jgi:hypothetical protein
MLAMQWSSIKWSLVLRLMLLGAVGFWLPDVLLHASRGYNFNSRDVWHVTAAAPLTLFVTFLLAKRTTKGARHSQVGPSMLAGVWLLGGISILLGASFSGGGFTSPDGRWLALTILLSVFPPYTLIMATYDGTLGALLLVTAVALIVWATQRSGILSRFARKEGTQKG